MRYAIQTIAWDDCPLETIISDVKAAGYDGIELFQHPKDLGGVASLVQTCRENKITVVGMCAGSFPERCDLVKEFCKEWGTSIDSQNAPYVYCDEWKSSIHVFSDKLKEGYRVALHPHMYKPIQTMREAEVALNDHLRLLFLPDTAHLTIAGDDPAKAVQKFRRQLAAVHVKDWKVEVGRSFQFYARGFCELGQGDIELGHVLDVLSEAGYGGWLVVEQDSTTTPLDSTKRSLEWLKEAVHARRFKNPRSYSGM